MRLLVDSHVFADSHEYVLVMGAPGRAPSLHTDAIRTEYAEASIGRMGRRWVNGRGVKGDDRGDQDSRQVNPLGARARSYVLITTGREKGNPHPAPMPLELAEHLVRLGSVEGEVVLDPFAGSGTTALAARRLGRRSINVELSDEYAAIAATRLAQLSLLAEEDAA